MAQTTEEQKTDEKPVETPTPADKEADKRFTQAELDAILKDRLERAEKKREKEAERAAEEARLKALEESKDLQKLSEERKKLLDDRDRELAELRAKLEIGEKAVAALRRQLDTELATVPDYIKTLLSRMPEAEQLEWLAANKASLIKSTDDADKNKRKIPGTPSGDPEKQLSAADEAIKRAQHARQVRSMF